MTRLYTLESNPVIGAGAWGNVSGFTDLVGNDQDVNYAAPAGGAQNFFRGKITLQGFSLALVDSDGDGLPDAWETAQFGNLSQTGDSIAANRQTVLQNFISGTDPTDSNSVFRLNVDLDGGLRTVSFQALSAQGAGYENKNRFYSLQSSADMATWMGVSRYTNLLGADQMIHFPVSNPAPHTFYRAEVWLQNQ